VLSIRPILWEDPFSFALRDAIMMFHDEQKLTWIQILDQGGLTRGDLSLFGPLERGLQDVQQGNGGLDRRCLETVCTPVTTNKRFKKQHESHQVEEVPFHIFNSYR